MRAERAAVLLTASALSRDLSMSAALRALSSAPAHRAAAAIDAGKLAEGLGHLRLDPGLAALAVRWPKALGPALRRFDRLPAVNHFRLHLAETLGYFFVVLMVQLAANAVLALKVLPTFSKMDPSVVLWLDLPQLAVELVTLLLIPLGLWVTMGASGWARLPGWGRHLARAREAAQAAALVEAGAPDDVRAEVTKRFGVLRSPSASPLDLDAQFEGACVDAERALQRFLIAIRVAGFTLLTLLALAMVLSVFATLSRLAWNV